MQLQDTYNIKLLDQYGELTDKELWHFGFEH